MTPYKCNPSVYRAFFNQSGSGPNFPVFRGTPYYGQRGGGFFGDLFRSSIPLLKAGGQHLLKQGLKSGAQVARDVLAGQNLKTSLKSRAKEAGKTLLSDTMRGVKRRVMSEPPVKTKKRKRTKQARSRADIFS